tara:strand:- start:1266 stop:2135 length:870 start_codon:yes stop_codon:yes gene_type:complete
MGTIASMNGVDDANISSVNGQTPNLDLSGSASAAPSVSTSGGLFGQVVATITKSGGGTYTNPNYSAECTLADGTVTVTDANIDRVLESDGSHLAGTLEISDTNASTAQRTITVKAQEFGDTTQSTVGTATYTPTSIQAKYIRFTGVLADGSATNKRLAIEDIRFFTGSGQSGTEYPTTDLTADDSETGITISAGHSFNSTYHPWKAFDSSSGTWWWALQTTAANNWIQIEFEDGTYSTKPIIKSLQVDFQNTWADTYYFKITTSANADHSSATDHGVFLANISTVTNFG